MLSQEIDAMIVRDGGVEGVIVTLDGLTGSPFYGEWNTRCRCWIFKPAPRS